MKNNFTFMDGLPVNRNFSLDLLKALSIFGVVFIHSSAILKGNIFVINFFSNMFRFSVPCFLIVWSFFLQILS